ncbi:MAG: MFS transporter [Treponema sp.]|nr:MFS transporter [Treponema sp.]
MSTVEVDRNTGIHRARLWQIAGFTLNNMATNLYMFYFFFIAYYMTGFVGVGVVLASTIIMLMRIWDGVTDPFIGYLVDRTNTKIGKNRPFMIIGNIMLLVFSFLMVHATHKFPAAARFPVFIVLYMLYIIGYTFQCVVTKSAQTCLTNDPKQRPIFAIFDGLLVTLLSAFMPMLVAALTKKYGGFNEQFFHNFWMIVAPISLLCTAVAIFSIASKDRLEFFGLGKVQKPNFKDYWEVLSKNRAIQMLVVSASTDKLALNAQSNGTVGVIVYGIVCGNFALQGALGAYTAIPTFLMLLFGVGYIARKLGQKKAMLFGTYGSLVTCALIIVLFYALDPMTFRLPKTDGYTGMTAFTVLYVLLFLLFKGFSGVSSNIVIPMTADCADYEVYRSKKYVPGLMGTVFSFVDKLISSLSATIVGLLCAAIGFKEQLPTIDTPFSPQLKFVGLFAMYGLVIIGLLFNVVAMKFYPLNKEKMAEIQAEIAKIKAEQGAAAQ